eukprot:TRINITY_DN15538_c0_g1_i1.p1 TRINITY_DN15538_c0_g1~~TRINITY_DN15538_c0_g1_i1.p1  ORF type:complete len:669 (-),score=76.89 TRINITY_DN15538_c0_g1_i1:272-2146(-)
MCCPTRGGMMLKCCMYTPPAPMQSPSPVQRKPESSPSDTWTWTSDNDHLADESGDRPESSTEHSDVLIETVSGEKRQVFRDPFADLLKPETMQPIYFLPVTNGLKQLFVFFVFGFDLKFKLKDGKPWWKLTKVFFSFIFRTLFIFLALNALRLDLKQFWQREALTQSAYQASLAFLAVWCTSPNFAAGLGLWAQLRIQSPAVVFSEDIEDAKYCYVWWFPEIACFCRCGCPDDPILQEVFSRGYNAVMFPVLPGSWLQIAKQIYALILLPYIIPAVGLEMVMSSLFTYWVVVKTHCCCLLSCVKVHLVALVFGFIWLASRGKNEQGRFQLELFWRQLWPFLYMYGVWVFASYIVPVFYAGFYGVLIWAQNSQIRKGIGVCVDKDPERNARLQFCLCQIEDLEDRAEDAGYHMGRCSMLGACLDRTLLNVAKCLPHRMLTLEEEDRVLLVRLDSHRLNRDFVFRDDTLVGGEAWRLDIKRQEKSRFTDSESSDEDSNEMYRVGRRLIDTLVGEENCQEGDRDADLEPELRKDFARARQKDNDGHNSLDDAEVQIVMLTISKLATVAIVQALTIFFIRTLSVNSFDGLCQCMRTTIEERHIAMWWHHVMTIAEQRIGMALNSVWSV